jgi:hypothetical protein
VSNHANWNFTVDLLVQINSDKVNVKQVVAQVPKLELLNFDILGIAPFERKAEDSETSVEVLHGFVLVHVDGDAVAITTVDHGGETACLAKTLGIGGAHPITDRGVNGLNVGKVLERCVTHGW